MIIYFSQFSQIHVLSQKYKLEEIPIHVGLVLDAIENF